MAEKSKSKKQVVDPKNEDQVVFDTIEESLTTGASWFIKNLNMILIALAIILAVIVGYICWKNFISKPKEAEAKESIWNAESLFSKGAYQEALDGNDSITGFLEIIDEYGSTTTGNLANAYAGLCYKELGDNENAIKYLEAFDSDSKMVQPSIYGAIGDVYWDMENAEKAISFYKKAAKEENAMMTPFYNKRAALAYLSIGKNDEALKLLESIEKNYPKFPEMEEVQKFIEFAKQAK